MSMVINLVEDHNIYLCEGGPVYNGGVQPTPITYLTQWRMMGNSTVHTDEYLTQWKVEGNSVVDNNAILSCGDLGQDGKYHVKISNGATIYDIPLTEPLRKVNDVADSIEFADGVATLTRKIGRTTLDSFSWKFYPGGSKRWGCFTTDIKPASSWQKAANILCTIYNTYSDKITSEGTVGICMLAAERIMIYDSNYTDSSYQTDFEAHIANVELIYEKITPTTETIQVSPFPISPTDTYTSVNDTPYSAFEYKKNVEIWSCGEYSEVDNKWHIRILPEGYGIVDIALNEPLRKVNDVADIIEFADGVAMPKRKFGSVILSNLFWRIQQINTSERYRFTTGSLMSVIKKTSGYANILTPLFDVAIADDVYAGKVQGISVAISGSIFLYDVNYNQADDLNAFLEHIQGVEFVYELATPTTEVIQVPQIEEAESYTCIISQGGKAVEWSSFETE